MLSSFQTGEEPLLFARQASFNAVYAVKFTI